MSTLGNINEKALELFDFAQRCQRPDGSIYGTNGRCRKGKEVSAEEKEKKKAKIGGGRKGKEVSAEVKEEKKAKIGGVLLSSGESLEKFRGTETVARLTARNKELEERAKSSPEDAEFIQTQLDKNNKILDKYEKNSKVLDSIVSNVPAGTEVSVTKGGAVKMEYTTKSGQEIKVLFGKKDYQFEVNGGFNAGTVTSRPQQIEVANAVRRNYNAVVKSLPQGAVIGTAAWMNDGRGASRTKAYERMGFSTPAGGPGGNQYARKSGDKMVPSNQSEEGLDQTYDFAEKSAKRDTALWFVAIFGGKLK